MQNEAVVEGYRLSPQQTRIWLLQQTDGSRVYRTQSAILIEGEIDVDSLKAAISDVISRHEILRARFHLLPGMTFPLQAIDPDQFPALREIDLSDCDPDEKSDCLDALFQEEARCHYDLKPEPAARFCLIRLSVAERVLLTSLPAICADSWSLKNLFRETARAYAANLHGARLADQPVQYVDFTEWQTEILERAEDDGEESWDRQDLQSSSASPLRLGLERETDRSSRFEPDCLSLRLDAEITAKIDRISSACNISPQVFLLACWQLLLWHLTGRKDIAIDHLCENRRIGALREAIGIFARFCPVSTHLEPDYQFAEMLEIVDQSIESAIASLNRILREDSKVMDSGGLAERTQAIGFEYEDWPQVERVGAARFSYWKQYSSIDRFKLKLGAYRKADDLTIEIQFDATVFSRDSVSLIQERYLVLIERAIQRDQALIGGLEIIGQRELEKLLIEWNATERKAPDRDCLHELIAKQAHSSPESIAVVYQNEQLSYEELESRANQVANHLKSLGVGPECVVGLYLERSTEMMVGLLGILKSGGAYLPLDVVQPAERLRIMLEDAGARVIVTEQDLAGRLPEGCRELVIIDGDWARVADCSREAPEVKMSPQNLAYVIYTSGSTGKPKGVMIRHDAVVNLLRGLQAAVYERARGTLTVSLNAPLGFDASVKQVIQLAHGHRLCIVPEKERIDAESMVEYVRSKEIDVLDCTPSHLDVLVEAGLKQGKKGPQIVLVGGEAVSARSWREMSGNGEVTFYNVYGPTECTVDATVCRVGEESEPTVGRQISNTRIYIMDESGEVTPTGVVGEICIGGSGLARGYRGEAGMTAERFVPDPYGGQSGERLYRSGDLGRYSEDGRIRYEGRRDAQVKLRGYRIELGEIEERLRSHPGVGEAVVMLREDEPGQKRLVGYVVGGQERIIDGKRRRMLPNGMAIVEQNRNETDYLYEEIYKKKSYFKHGIRLSDGGCVFDVGANIGLFSLFVSQNRKELRVYAFEPLMPIFETLRINVRLYGGRGVKLYQLGLGEEKKKECYTYYPGYSMMSGERRYARAAEDIDVIKKYMRAERQVEMPEELLTAADEILARRFEEEKYECEVRRLTDVMKEERIERIDLLKVDVQRAEMDVLRGLEEEDWEKIDQIVMEVHDQEGGESEGRLERMRELLRGRGYEVVIEQDELLGGTDRYNLYARRNGTVERVKDQEWEEVGVDETGEEVTEERLRNYVRESLPDYMVPSAIVILDEFPLTLNGKVDRRALPTPGRVKKEAIIEEQEGQNAYEEIIGGIWKDVLKVEHIKPGANFFEIGGHSLLATQVVSRMRNAFGVEIGLLSIFEEPMIEGLARRVEYLSRIGVIEDAPPLVRVPRNGKLPLSFAQQRLWFLDQLAPNSPLYNCPRAVRLEGPLDIEALEYAINEIVRRHEALRTRIEIDDDAPVQVIDEWAHRKLQIEDLTSFTLEEREAAAARMISEEAATGFDLKRGPLLRVKVLRLGEGQHIVLFTMHHIVSDGWSIGILIREVNALYKSYSEGESSPLEELAIQYADYAVWQREWLQGEVLEKLLAYWKRQLAGVPSLLTLPADRPRPAVQTYRGAFERFGLRRELSDELKRLSRNEGVTSFMTLLAGLQLLLARYSGEDRIAVGSPIAGRSRQETEGLIGFLVNTLVMVADVSGNPTVRELLQQVRERAIGAFAHQDLPFEKLVEELQPERSLSHQPLFQVLFAFQNYPEEPLAISGLKVGGGSIGAGNTDFDLMLTLVESGSRISGSLGYARDLYEKESILRLSRHLVRLLEGMASNRECRVLDIPLLTEEETAQVLECNQTAVEYATERCIHEMFEDQAELAPDRVAGINEGEQISYGELNRRANRLGNYLRRRCVGAEVRVGICLERGLEMLVGLLGILKAGGAYVPLDPAYPAERLAFMLEDAAVRLIVTQEKLKEISELAQTALICVDGDRGEILQESEENIDSGVNGENLAYIIYTSGSTGHPKGAMLTHQSVVNLITDAIDKFRLDRDSKFFQFASLSFDVAVEEIFPALSIGAAVALQADNLLYSYSDLAKTLERHEVTTVELPTIYWVEWMRELSKMRRRAPRSLNLVIIGGEKISPEILKEWREHEIPLLHVFGVTEVAVTSIVYQVHEDLGADPMFTEIPIGLPIANTEVYLLDGGLQQMPLRIPSDMYLGGIGLARGYLNRPDLTAARFVPSPFGEQSGSRLYKTGDLARYSADGYIEFIGRIDHQVKIRGYRIEPAEVESVLMQAPSIRECTVIARDVEPDDKRLVAYLVLKEGEAKTDLRRFLKQRLPAYMIPSSFVTLESLPLTAHGKVDRQRLPAPGKQDIEPGGMYVAPNTPIEKDVARICGEVLRFEDVGIYDDFFALGGHSLLVTQVINRINSAFQVELPVRALFDAPTVSGLVAAIVESQVGQTGDDVLSQMLAELEGLSEDEVDAVLNG
jgi:amino acid adenylation domain-containing protein/FkbM family methyltransferase